MLRQHRYLRTSLKGVSGASLRPGTTRSLCLLIATLASVASAFGEPLKALPAGAQPNDQRLQPLLDLNGYFPFAPSTSPIEWNQRAAHVRRRILVSQGLWPMPRKTPLNAVIHGKLERDTYTVEKVYFESFPGFYVTGNLYRPRTTSGRVPAVLCPHGHWANGRFHDKGAAQTLAEIKRGEEQFPDSGRSHLQARCVTLARMGCVVFHYDMIGYADSTQISFDLAHRFAVQRPHLNQPSGWGLFSPPAESHLQSVMGLQTYNSLRAVDFLQSLPDVDADRLAVTGASGGGTQSFILAAIDPRIKVSVPAVMVSTAMQGGCTCENACGLRVGTGNVEFAALVAPRPQALTAANDWTLEMKTKGFPQLQQHYQMLGAGKRIYLHSRVEFGHNYNLPSRLAMYHWLNKHLQLGVQEPIVETDFQRLTTAEMTVWNEAEHPQPKGGEAFEQQLLQSWHDDSQHQLAALTPRDANGWKSYRRVVGGALATIIGRELPDAKHISYERTTKADRGSYIEIVGRVSNRLHQEELPVAFFHPKDWNGQVVIWADPAGKQSLYGPSGDPQTDVSRLLDAGMSIVGVDLLQQGEFLKDGKPPKRARKVANPRAAAAYTFGYNHALFAKRVHDLLTMVVFVRNHEEQPQAVYLVGLNGAGPWVAAARAQAGSQVTRAAIDSQKFRFGEVGDLLHPSFLPGGAKYGDLPGFLSLSAPHALWLSGEGTSPELIQAAYAATNAADALTLYNGTMPTSAAIDWLLQDRETD
ncbi:MAG: acetylxylan esterase [Planctomycetaceae bacterium]|nr:acetylxylan esterase [Planctomycetaceae bacterium]